jgi:acyl carrier protein
MGAHGMTRPQIQSAVADILSITVRRAITATETVVRDSEPAWDSLKHVELIFMLEDRFRIQFHEDEMPVLRSSEDIVRSLEGKLAA